MCVCVCVFYDQGKWGFRFVPTHSLFSHRQYSKSAVLIGNSYFISTFHAAPNAVPCSFCRNLNLPWICNGDIIILGTTNMPFKVYRGSELTLYCSCLTEWSSIDVHASSGGLSLRRLERVQEKQHCASHCDSLLECYRSFFQGG